MTLYGSIIQEDVLFHLARSMHLLPFEARKDAQAVFGNAFRFVPYNDPDKNTPVMRYLQGSRPEVIIELCRGYDHPQSAMQCGTILREAIKNDMLTALLLYDQSGPDEPAVRLGDVKPSNLQSGNGIFWRFFDWINKGNFEVSTDAFNTFKVCQRPFLSSHCKVLLPCRTFSQSTKSLYRST